MIHLTRSAAALSECDRIIVLGSASVLASHPELGETDLLARTYDADLLLDPWHEETALVVHDTLGEDETFHERFGYHADILRPEIVEQLPPDWEQRLVPVPRVAGAFAISPSDLACAKCLVGRPKDVSLIAHLLKLGHVEESRVSELLQSMALHEPLDRRAFSALHRATLEAAASA